MEQYNMFIYILQTMYRNEVLKGQANNINLQYNMFVATVTQQSWFWKVISLYIKFKLIKRSTKD